MDKVKIFFAAKEENVTLIVRLILGIVMFMHGLQKATPLFGGGGWAATAQMMSQNLPVVIAHLVIFGELFGGLAIIVGFLTRAASIGIAIIMAGAVFLVHIQGGFFASNKGFEYPLVLLVLAIFYSMSRPEALSVDGLLFGKNKKG